MHNNSTRLCISVVVQLTVYIDISMSEVLTIIIIIHDSFPLQSYISVI